MVEYWRASLPSSSKTCRDASARPSTSIKEELGRPPAKEMMRGSVETANNFPRNDGGTQRIRSANRYGIIPLILHVLGAGKEKV
ncbi:MAG: hypothetical protein A4E40_00226 [Methanoregulaceae archaeon PtaU1.Bin059]|nr:MAG: hypothetical protein A4E40_00226 [Methanoregulaceae archaeon PtaU1.Bin059]